MVLLCRLLGINTLHIGVLQDNHTSQEFDVGRAQSAMKACLQCAHSRIPAMYGSLVIQPPKWCFFVYLHWKTLLSRSFRGQGQRSRPWKCVIKICLVNIFQKGHTTMILFIIVWDLCGPKSMICDSWGAKMVIFGPKKCCCAQKNDFFKKSKKPNLGFAKSNIHSNFQSSRLKTVAWSASTHTQTNTQTTKTRRTIYFWLWWIGEECISRWVIQQVF